MRLKAVLGIKSNGNKKVKIYRIQDLDTNQIKDITVKTIIETIKIKGIYIEGLQLQGNEIKETYEIPIITEIKRNSISLYQWCLQNGERGQRILTEFQTGNNYPIAEHDVSFSSGLKMKFRCKTCQKISEQKVSNKTSENNNKCKFCAGQSREISLQDWCLHEKTGYGKQLLQEYIQGNNHTPADKISYGSHQKAYFKCSNCGSVNYKSIHDRTMYKQKNCIKCNPESTSFGEQLILKWLQSQGIQAISQQPLSSEAGIKYFDIYLPQLNLLIEHQSAEHKSIQYDINDQLRELIAQQNGINLLEVCELSSGYHRTENQWCITYELFNKHQMIDKIQQWFLINYNLQLSNIITPEVGRSAWQVKFPIKYEDSIAYNYPEVAAQFIPELNYGLTPDLIPHNSGYKFWIQGPNDSEPVFREIYSRTHKKKQ